MFLADTGMGLVSSKEKSLYRAGTRWVKHAGKGTKNRFLCGKCAHALVHADCILSRDFGIYKTYFSDLKVVGSI